MKIRVRQYNDSKKLVSDTGFKKLKFKKLKENNMSNWRVIKSNESNPVNPSHYKLSGGREAIDIIQEILTPEQFIGFLRGNIFKYDIRYKQKGGVEDLRKSAWYKEKLIEVEKIYIQNIK